MLLQLLAQQALICSFNIGSIELHWHLDTGQPEDKVRVKSRIVLHPDARDVLGAWREASKDEAFPHAQHHAQPGNQEQPPTA